MYTNGIVLLGKYTWYRYAYNVWENAMLFVVMVGRTKLNFRKKFSGLSHCVLWLIDFQ